MYSSTVCGEDDPRAAQTTPHVELDSLLLDLGLDRIELFAVGVDRAGHCLLLAFDPIHLDHRNLVLLGRSGERALRGAVLLELGARI